jgi:hypothetical protein
MEVNNMSTSKKSCAIILSVAFIVGLSGIARADAVHHRNQTAKVTPPTTEAILRKIQGQNVYGMAVVKPQPTCNDITCPGYALVGIGF